MKNVKFIFWVLISVIVLFPLYTSAESITNINGIEISEEEYNNFLKVYTHEYIMTMNEEKYERLKSLNFSDDNIITDKKYFTSAYNQHLDLTTEREITEEEFESFGLIQPIIDSGGDYIETSAKSLTLSVIGDDDTYSVVTLFSTWKGQPSTRSFDVIGVRGFGFTFRNGSQTGEQIYTENGEYKVIDYHWNGTNIKRFDNGFGISMNVVNSKNLGSLQFVANCDIKPTMDRPTLFGSYQHAVKTTTLEESQNYTLGLTGLGDVFVYPYSISQKYDGMTGTRIQY